MEEETTDLNCVIYGHNFLVDLKEEMKVNTNSNTFLTFPFIFDDKEFKVIFNALPMDGPFREKLADAFENKNKPEIIFIVFDLCKKKDFETLNSLDFRKYLERYDKNSFKVFIEYLKKDIPFNDPFVIVDPNDVEKYAKENEGISEAMIHKCYNSLMRVIELYLIKKYKKKYDEIDEDSVGKDKKKCEKCCNNRFCLIY